MDWLGAFKLAPLLFLNVNLLSVELLHHESGNRDFNMLGFEPRDSISLRTDIQILGPVFFDSTVHGSTDPSQFRHVGWEFRVGVRIFNELEFGRYHHSQHVLDANYAVSGYPLIDAWYVRITIKP